MIQQPAKDGELKENPEDHLGIIYVETGRLRAIYGGLEYNEVLAEFYIILHRCCQLFDESKGFTFATYAHAACNKSRRIVVQRIKFGKRSDKREIFGLKMVRYEEQWGQVSDRDEGIAHIDNMDELDYLLDNANPVGVEAMFAGEFDGESHTEIGKRLGHDRSYIGNLKAAALAKARRVAKRGEQ